MIPGKIVTIPQNISNAATAKNVFEAFEEKGGVFLSCKPLSSWENNRIVYVVKQTNGSINNGNMYRYRDGVIAGIPNNASNYDAIAKTGDEYYFVGGTE